MGVVRDWEKRPRQPKSRGSGPARGVYCRAPANRPRAFPRVIVYVTYFFGVPPILAAASPRPPRRRALRWSSAACPAPGGGLGGGGAAPKRKSLAGRKGGHRAPAMTIGFGVSEKPE